MQWTIKRLHFRDAHLSYSSFGSDKDRAVLLLHGAFLSGLAWQPLIKALVAQNYFVVVPDLRGHGDSSPVTSDWSILDFAEDVYLALAHLGIEQAAIIGHSLGAMVALYLAAHYSWQVLGLALLEPSWPGRGLMSTVFKYLPVSMKARKIEEWHGLHSIGEDSELHNMIHRNLTRSAQGKPEWQTVWPLLTRFDELAVAPKITVPTVFLINEHRSSPGRPDALLVDAIAHADRRVVQTSGNAESMLYQTDTQVELSKCIRSFWQKSQVSE